MYVGTGKSEEGLGKMDQQTGGLTLGGLGGIDLGIITNVVRSPGANHDRLSCASVTSVSDNRPLTGRCDSLILNIAVSRSSRDTNSSQYSAIHHRN